MVRVIIFVFFLFLAIAGEENKKNFYLSFSTFFNNVSFGGAELYGPQKIEGVYDYSLESFLLEERGSLRGFGGRAVFGVTMIKDLLDVLDGGFSIQFETQRSFFLGIENKKIKNDIVGVEISPSFDIGFKEKRKNIRAEIFGLGVYYNTDSEVLNLKTSAIMKVHYKMVFIGIGGGVNFLEKKEKFKKPHNSNLTWFDFEVGVRIL